MMASPRLALFDGQYRSKPIVTMRGASRQEEQSALLLRRAHQQREERVRERQRIRAATVIQSVYRAHRVRQHVYNNLRAQFDSTDLHQVSLIHLSSQLLFIFYSHQHDHHRLVRLGHCWVMLWNDLIPLIDTIIISLRRLLALSCDSLYRLPGQPLATPLRLLEVFADSSNYPPQHRSVVSTIYGHLISRGYYRMLRRVIEVRVPEPDELIPGHTHYHTLTATLLDMCVRPLVVMETQSIEWILRELMCAPLSYHVRYLILPYLSLHTTIKQVISQATNMATSSSQATNMATSSSQATNMATSSSQATNMATSSSQATSSSTSSSPEMLYCLMELVSLSDGPLTPECVIELIILVAETLTHTPTRPLTALATDGDDEDDMMVTTTQHESDVLQNVIRFVTDGPLALLILSQPDSEQLISSVSSLCYVLVERVPSPHETVLFRSLSLSPQLLQSLWSSVSSMSVQRVFGDPLPCLFSMRHGLPLPHCQTATLLQQLSSFSLLLSLSLSGLHDVELCTQCPFSVSTMNDIAHSLRDVYVNLHTIKHPISHTTMHYAAKYLKDILCQINDRNSRVELISSGKWPCLSLNRIPLELFVVDMDGDDQPRPLMVPQVVRTHADLLRQTPFVFSFRERVEFFQRLIAHDKELVQGSLQDFLIGQSVNVKARRNHMYEDAFSELAQTDLRKKLRVNLVNAQGLEEAGIDGGGLFREFLSETLRAGLDPNKGYFVYTADSDLYPNPNVHLVSGDSTIHYRFLGALLGKALYEQHMVDLPFAHFFLRKLTLSGDGCVDTHHLSSLDQDLYRQMLWLKQYHGEVEELWLNFTVTTNQFDQVKVVPLKPDGYSIAVVNSNRMEYIHCLSDYYLNRQLEDQFIAFREGLCSVIPQDWLSLFDHYELQVLISGAQVAIDVEDLKNNTKYYGDAASADESHIMMFWDVVEGMDQTNRSLLLKFVTSCSRPPLLGFSELQPQFSIQLVPNFDHLPTASTCMHLLKLPMFQDIETMRDKVIYAITSGAGFELS